MACVIHCRAFDTWLRANRKKYDQENKMSRSFVGKTTWLKMYFIFENCLSMHVRNTRDDSYIDSLYTDGIKCKLEWVELGKIFRHARANIFRVCSQKTAFLLYCTAAVHAILKLGSNASLFLSLKFQFLPEVHLPITSTKVTCLSREIWRQSRLTRQHRLRDCQD